MGARDISPRYARILDLRKKLQPVCKALQFQYARIAFNNYDVALLNKDRNGTQLNQLLF